MQKRIIIKQQDKKDCGICCLASIIRYYDGYVPLEKIREDTMSSNRGTSAFHMVEALKKYGFDAYGRRLKKENLIKEDFPLPAIVHVVLDNGLNHYMVLYEKRKDKMILMDPSYGKRVMSDTDFLWIWSEVLIIAYPKEKIRIEEKKENDFTLFLKFCGSNKLKLNHLIYIDIICFGISIITTFYLKMALKYIDRKLELYGIVILFFLFTAIKILFLKDSNARHYELNKRFTLLHASTFLEHLFCLPLSSFKTRSVGDYLNRFWESLELKDLYTDLFRNGFLSSITLFGSFGLLFLINESFFHYFLLISILYLIIQRYLQAQCYKIEKEYLIEKTKFQDGLLEKISNFETYYFLNLKSQLQETSEEELIDYFTKEKERNVFYQKNFNRQNMLKEMIEFSFLTLGIFLLQQEKMLVIDFLLIQTLGSYIISALTTIANLIPKEKYLKNILHKETEFLAIKEEKMTQTLPFQNGTIIFNNVNFTYNKYNYVLKNFSLNIYEKEHILLFGKSGSGKSTICQLLTRAIIPSSGEIKIKNINIQDLNLESLKSSIVYLNQNSRLLTGSIQENIILNRPFNFQKFQEVCKLCHIEEIISKKPLRYETTISAEESFLSGGEQQRIMLARTLYSNAKIFLLDESLSEVEEKLEKEIIKNIRLFLKDSTLIYISHKNHKALFDEVIKLEVTNEQVFIS